MLESGSAGSFLVMGSALAGYLYEFARGALALCGALALGLWLAHVLRQRARSQALGPVQVVQRIALEPRKALYVVRAGERMLLIGCGDGAAPALLAELTGVEGGVTSGAAEATAGDAP